MLLTKEIEIKVTKANYKDLIQKGYNCNLKDRIIIKTQDLGDHSGRKIQYQCDNPECGKIVEVKWEDYIKKRKGNVPKDYCQKCCKTEQAKWMKENRKEKYEEINQKRFETSQKTLQKKYGVNNIMQLDFVKENYKKNFKKKYGCENLMQVEDFRKRLYENLSLNQGKEYVEDRNGKKYYRYNNFPCSKNQKHLQEVYGGELNQSINFMYNVDILLDNKIYIEYNGTGHKLGVIMHHMTEEEFNKKEKKRYYSLKKLGYKGIFFDSYTKGKLPKDSVLLSLKELALNFLKKEENNWIVFDLDNHLIKTKFKKYPYDYTYILDNDFLNIILNNNV